MPGFLVLKLKQNHQAAVDVDFQVVTSFPTAESLGLHGQVLLERNHSPLTSPVVGVGVGIAILGSMARLYPLKQ